MATKHINRVCDPDLTFESIDCFADVPVLFKQLLVMAATLGAISSNYKR